MKWCPLATIANTVSRCHSNSCGWWDSKNNCCAILTFLTTNTKGED